MDIYVPTNDEILENYVGISWSDFDESDRRDVIATFHQIAIDNLQVAGFDCNQITGRHNTVRGWLGANVYQTKILLIRAYRKMSNWERELAYDAIDRAYDATRDMFAA